MKKLEPLCFAPIYQNYLWGGERIAKCFHRHDTPHPCAESWEISDRPGEMSRVSDGPFKGQTLHELMVQYGERMLGRRRKDTSFPLLVKIIDAKEPLSVQVHPSEDMAHLGEPKTEMWVALEGGPVYAGFKKEVSRHEFLQALKENRVVDLMRKISAKVGDVIFIPGGRIHAIGAGCLMLEVQQSSNTTFRVYDWNRTGPDGKARLLHLKEALQCIKFDDDNDPISSAQLVSSDGASQRWTLLSTLFFIVEKWEISGLYRVNNDPDTFQIFFHLSGKQKGLAVLVPADSSPYDLVGPVSVLRITMPPV